MSCCPVRKWWARHRPRRSAASVSYELVRSPSAATTTIMLTCDSTSESETSSVPVPLLLPCKPTTKITIATVQMPIAGVCTRAHIVFACATERTVYVLNRHTHKVERVLGPGAFVPSAIAWMDETAAVAKNALVTMPTLLLGNKTGQILLAATDNASDDGTRVLARIGAPIRALWYDASQDVLLAGIAAREPGEQCMLTFSWSRLCQASDDETVIVSPLARAGSLCIAGRAVTACVSVCADPARPGSAWAIEHADRSGVRIGEFTFDGHPLQTLATIPNGRACTARWATRHSFIVAEPEMISMFTRANASARLTLARTWPAQRFGFDSILPSTIMIDTCLAHAATVWFVHDATERKLMAATTPTTTARTMLVSFAL